MLSYDQKDHCNSTGQMHDPVLSHLKSVVQKESEALDKLVEHFPANASLLVQSLVMLQGSLFFTGIGKSGCIGQKLASTFSSLGMRSHFIYPVEALHGDIGRLQAGDHCILLSKNGSGRELEQLIIALRSLQVHTTLVCCHQGQASFMVDTCILLPFAGEACHLAMAPTSSSTVMLAFGDALAIVASKLRGFTDKDFAQRHPAGSLGSKLLLTVKGIMHTHDSLPFLTPLNSFQEILSIMTEKKLGVGIVVDKNTNICGIITDGDIRRIIKRGPEIFACNAHDLMTHNPKTITMSCMAYDALQIMKNYNITTLIVTQKRHAIGLIHMHDIVKAGIHP